MKTCARGRRLQTVILPLFFVFVLCLMETSVLGTALAFLWGFKSEGKVFSSVDLALYLNIDAVKQIISNQRAEWIAVWILVPFCIIS